MMSQKKKTIFYTIFRKPCDKTLAYFKISCQENQILYEAQFPPHFSIDEKKTSNQVFYQYGK